MSHLSQYPIVAITDFPPYSMVQFLNQPLLLSRYLMSGRFDVRPQVEVLVLHADRHVAGQGALLRRGSGGRQDAAVVAVSAPHNLKYFNEKML